MYPPGLEADFEFHLKSSRLDLDAINAILKTGKRADVPPDLGQEWINHWDDVELFDLAILAPAQRQHTLASIYDSFLQNPIHRIRRANFAATQTADPDLRIAGELAIEMVDILIAFNREVIKPTTSPFTGKVKYAVLTDLDVVTSKAVVEVSNQPDASGKVAQLAVLLGSIANPNRLPVFHYFPNLDPASRAAKALEAGGSAGVYNDRAAIVTAIRALA